jgi:hypothetical protein
MKNKLNNFGGSAYKLMLIFVTKTDIDIQMNSKKLC